MTMLDRVARAVFRSGFHPDDSVDEIGKRWDEFDLDRRAARRQAYAAIIAVRGILREIAEGAEMGGDGSVMGAVDLILSPPNPADTPSSTASAAASNKQNPGPV